MSEGINTTITINLVDIIVCLLCAFTTSSFISWLQKTPSRPVGIMDFILGNLPRNENIKSIGFVLLTPMIIGFLVGFLDISSPISAGVGTGLGAFLSVSTAFLNSKLLAPPLRKQLPKARRVYLGFVIIYALIGLSGAYITNALPEILNNQSVLANLFSSAISGLFFIFGSTVFFFIRNRYKNAFPLAERSDDKEENGPLVVNDHTELLSPHLRNMIQMEVVRSFEEAAVNAEQQSKISSEEFSYLISQEISRQLPEIVRMIDLAYKQDLIRKEFGSNYKYDYDYIYKVYQYGNEFYLPYNNSYEEEFGWNNKYYGERSDAELASPYHYEDAWGNIKWYYPRHFS